MRGCFAVKAPLSGAATMDQRNFVFQRERMVIEQLVSRDIIDKRVIGAMLEIPQEEFIPLEYRYQAYADEPLPIGEGQTISQPYIVALMTQLLGLKGEEKVLEVGTGSGYQAAILAKLAKEVYTIERHKSLLAKTKRVFEKLKLDNIVARVGDGSKGWEKYAPFEGIIVTAAAKSIPPALVEQLAIGGRLVIPVGSGWGQDLLRLTKTGKRIKKESFGACAFVPLVVSNPRG